MNLKTVGKPILKVTVQAILKETAYKQIRK
jgi:hypothetical protein